MVLKSSPQNRRPKNRPKKLNKQSNTPSQTAGSRRILRHANPSPGPSRPPPLQRPCRCLPPGCARTPARHPARTLRSMGRGSPSPGPTLSLFPLRRARNRHRQPSREWVAQLEALDFDALPRRNQIDYLLLWDDIQNAIRMQAPRDPQPKERRRVPKFCPAPGGPARSPLPPGAARSALLRRNPARGDPRPSKPGSNPGGKRPRTTPRSSDPPPARCGVPRGCWVASNAP